MTQYFGDFAEDETVYIPFNTFDSNDPSASVTITNLADADIMVHKDGGTTQIATDGATVAIDFDSITGNHLITIDTSAHADYTTGSDYLVRIEGTTVDAATINAWVGSFSIENRFMRGTDSANTVVPPTVAEFEARTLPSADYVVVGDTIAGVTLVTTCTTNTDMRGTDSAATAAELAKVPKSDSNVTFNATALASINAEADTALADYDGPTNTEMVARTIAAADYLVEGDTLARVTLVDTTTTNTDMRGTDSAATEAKQDIIDANIDIMVSGIIEGAAATGTLSTTQASTNLSGYTDDQLIGRHITVLSGVAEGEQSDITDYADTNGVLTFTAMTLAMSNGDTFKIT